MHEHNEGRPTKREEGLALLQELEAACAQRSSEFPHFKSVTWDEWSVGYTTFNFICFDSAFKFSPTQLEEHVSQLLPKFWKIKNCFVDAHGRLVHVVLVATGEG